MASGYDLCRQRLRLCQSLYQRPKAASTCATNMSFREKHQTECLYARAALLQLLVYNGILGTSTATLHLHTHLEKPVLFLFNLATTSSRERSAFSKISVAYNAFGNCSTIDRLVTNSNMRLAQTTSAWILMPHALLVDKSYLQYCAKG